MLILPNIDFAELYSICQLNINVCSMEIKSKIPNRPRSKCNVHCLMSSFLFVKRFGCPLPPNNSFERDIWTIDCVAEADRMQHKR